ncbi:MAG: hypothetical protein B7X39_19195 [Lysobacterales bacterium 14-68-21]|jgi:hypothetical protein|nr:MAG: hypothetical protein B7X45_01565 [Xanthomonadales bacterium 15-68-25]OZB63523.1 MAG: hypothetical protein B7X39_19195 [Xanthomonadales bacterium 14-68-21]
MRAVWQLSLLLWRQMAVLVVLTGGLWLCGMGLLAWSVRGDTGLAGIGINVIVFGGWFWHVGQGQVLRGLCRPESFLLPGFRNRLAGAGALDLLLWAGLPAALAALCGVHYATLTAAGLLLVMAVGLASGTGKPVGLLIWAGFIAVIWKPQLAERVVDIALRSPWTPALLALAAMLALRLVFRPLLRIEDIEPDTSPLESTGLGRMRSRATEGRPARGAIAKRIQGWFDGTAQRAMERAMAAYRRHPGARQRMALIRSLLLPHDNPEAIALRMVLVAAIVAAYFFAILHRPHYNAAVIGAYAVLLSLSRFPQLGRGMLRMRPNLADLYLTLAPASRSEYQKTLVHALLLLVPVTVLSALAYTALGIVLVHATEPGRMLLTAAIVGAAASLVALAVHLIGPEGSFGRGVVNLVVVLGAMGSYWGGYVLLGLLGMELGGALLALVAISFGLGVWFAAQREYQRRTPCFDPPPA